MTRLSATPGEICRRSRSVSAGTREVTIGALHGIVRSRLSSGTENDSIEQMRQVESATLFLLHETGLALDCCCRESYDR